MPDPFDAVNQGFINTRVFDAADDAQTRVAKAQAFLESAPVSDAKRAWILRGIHGYALREQQPQIAAELAQGQERAVDLARVNAGLEDQANLPLGLGYPSLLANRGVRALTSGVHRAIGGAAEVAVGKNALSDFERQRAQDLMAPDSQLNSKVQKGVDIAGGMVPMLSPAGALTIGGGQGAATALDAGAGRGTAALAGALTGAANAFLPMAAGSRVAAAAAPIKTAVPGLVGNVLGNAAEGAAMGTMLGIGNTVGQVPTAVDTGSMAPVTEQASAIPEMALLGAGMHPIVAGANRIGEAQRLREDIAAQEPILAQQRAEKAAADAEQAKIDDAAIARQQQVDAGLDANAARTDTIAQRHAAAIEDSIAALGERVGASREEVLADLNARAQEYVQRGIPELPARIKAAQELSANIRQFADQTAAQRAQQATVGMVQRERAPFRAEQEKAAVAMNEAEARAIPDALAAQRALDATARSIQREAAPFRTEQEKAAIEMNHQAEQARMGGRPDIVAKNAQLNKGVQESAGRQLASQEAIDPAQELISLKQQVADLTARIQSKEAANAPAIPPVSEPAPPVAGTALPSQQEVSNAQTVRSDQGRLPQEGVQPTGSQNSGSQNLQQPAQTESKARVGAQRVARTVLGENDRLQVIAEGGKVWMQDKKSGQQYAIKPDSPAMRQAYLDKVGVRPKAQAPAPEQPVQPTAEAPISEKSPARLAWEAEKSKLSGGITEPVIASEDIGGISERPRSKDAYREGMNRRGSFDPAQILLDTWDAGAKGVGEAVRIAREQLGRIPTEQEVDALRAKYREMINDSDAAAKSGFWNRTDDWVRNALSMEAVAARNPETRRVVGIVQRMRDHENMVVGQHMRAADPFVSAPAAERPLLTKAAFHFIFENPRGSLDSPLPDGTRLTPEQQSRLQAGFDATRKATQEFVAEIDRASGISPELAKFRDIMKNLIADPKNRYIPMRRFGNERLIGKADTQEVLARLGAKGKLTGPEATVFRLAKMAAMNGEKDFTYYYGAADSREALVSQAARDAAPYEAAAGKPLTYDKYNADFDRAKSFGLSFDQVSRLGIQAGLEPPAILDMLSALPMRGPKASALEARGIPGMSTDNARSVGQWFGHMAAMRAKAGQARQLAQAMDRISDPAMRKRMSDYVELQSKPVSPIATTGKAFLNLFAMGFRPASAMAEGVGGIIMAPAKMLAIGMPRDSALAFGEMAKSNALNLWRIAHLGKESMLDISKRGMNKQMADDAQLSADTGRFGNQAFRDEMRAQSKSVIQGLTEKAMFLHRNLREANALGVWSAAYKMAAEGRMPAHVTKALEMQGIDLGTRTPREIADAITDFTMNRVDKTTMPMWQSATPAGQVLGTLTSYQTRSLAQMMDIARVWHRIPETRAYGAGATTALLALFGAGAIPFGNWVMQAANMTDSDPRTLEAKALSNKGVEAAMYGVTGLAAEAVAKGMGASDMDARKVAHRFDAFARRTAWGNFLHENSLALSDQIPAYSLLASMARSGQMSAEGIERGDWWTAAEGAAGMGSLAARDLVKGSRAAITGKIVNSKGDTVKTDATAGEAAMQIAGLGSNPTQQAGADASTKMAISQARNNALKRFAYRFANADGDVSDVIEDINAWNAKYLARNDAIGWAMVLDGEAINNAIKRAMTKEIMGAHESAVTGARGAEALVLQENE